MLGHSGILHMGSNYKFDRITTTLTFNLLDIWTSKNNRLDVVEGK